MSERSFLERNYLSLAIDLLDYEIKFAKYSDVRYH